MQQYHLRLNAVRYGQYLLVHISIKINQWYSIILPEINFVESDQLDFGPHQHSCRYHHNHKPLVIINDPKWTTTFAHIIMSFSI